MASAAQRTVSLAIPPKPDYIVLVRLALSAICRLTPLQPDDVADLKLAVTEVSTERLTGAREGPVRMAFEVQDDRLLVEIHAAAAPEGSDHTLSRAIVEATVDEVSYHDGSVRLMKRLSAGDVLDLDAD